MFSNLNACHVFCLLISVVGHFVHRAIRIVGPRSWNHLLDDVTSAESLSDNCWLFV